MDETTPKVGVGLFIIRKGQTILGRRLGSHGAGEYGGCGGHLKPGETFEAAARRELAEEMGPNLQIKNIRFLCLTNLRRYQPKYYIDVGLVADWVLGEPQVMEPDKVESWGWFDLDNLPEPLFSPISNYATAYKTGQNCFQTD